MDEWMIKDEWMKVGVNDQGWMGEWMKVGVSD